MNIEDIVKSLVVTSSLSSSTLKEILSGVVSQDLSISDVQTNLSKYIKIFKMATI